MQQFAWPPRFLRTLAPLTPRILRTLAPLALLLCMTACGGSASEKPFETSFPVPTPPGGNGGGGTPLPPPVTPQTPVWSDNAFGYGRNALFGAFPSDLVRLGNTLFAVDADAIEIAGARILAIDVSGTAPQPSTQFATTTILASHLRDNAGQAVDPMNPIGFGFFVNEMLLLSERLAFVLVNAGGSDSNPTLSNVLAFDPTSGQVLQTLNLALPFTPAPMSATSAGNPMIGPYPQSGAEALAYVPTSGTRGRLYIAMANLIFGAPSYGAVKLPGTIQVLEVDAASPTPLSNAALAPGLPFVIQTQGFNPVALTAIGLASDGTGQASVRILVTIAGTTDYDANFNLVPVTPAAVEAYEATSGTYEGRFNLGMTGLAAVRPALGRDGAGYRVGFFPSSVTGEVYLLQLDGLYRATIDPSELRVLRGPLNGIPVTNALAGGPGGNITGIALAPEGRTLVVTGFGDLFQFPPVPGQLFLLSLPHDLVSGSTFGADFVPGATRFDATPGRTVGGVALVPNEGGRPDVFVNVSGTLDANFLGNGAASLGSLQTFGLIR